MEIKLGIETSPLPRFLTKPKINSLKEAFSIISSSFMYASGKAISGNKINLVPRLSFKSFKVISLKKNLGSQRCIAVGLKYLQKENKDYIITILDSDGEDDPSKINEMIEAWNRGFEIISAVRDDSLVIQPISWEVA